MDGFLDGSTDGYAGRIEVLEGRSGRRMRSEAERARIAAESLAPGAKVADIARRHGATRWQGGIGHDHDQAHVRLNRHGQSGPESLCRSYPASSGRRTRSGRTSRQSSPSNRAENCAGDIFITPSCTCPNPAGTRSAQQRGSPMICCARRKTGAGAAQAVPARNRSRAEDRDPKGRDAPARLGCRPQRGWN